MRAVLRYLSRVGVVKYTCHSGYLSTVINENDLATVLAQAGGIFRARRVPGQEVEYGDTIGQILDPFTAEVVAPVTATTSGWYSSPLISRLCWNMKWHLN